MGLLLFSGVFLLIAGLTAADMILDYREGAGLLHQVLEGLVILLGGIAATFLTLQWLRLKKEAARLKTHLGASLAEAQLWKRETQSLLQGLGAAIFKQFERWNLSPAEREVGLLLLKGFSLKEISALRNTSERTVRQQAGEVYRKAKLGNRAELSAFFLEDLLFPPAASMGKP